MGDRDDLLAALAAARASSTARPRSPRRSNAAPRSSGVFVNADARPRHADRRRRRPDDDPAARRRGPAFCAEVARRTGCRVIKAARVRGRADVQALAPFHTDFHLLDSYTPGVPGGTGETFAWEIARAHRGRVPVILSRRADADNVAEAIAAVGPYAVDVASGVELRPGQKDPDKLAAFAAAVASTTVARGRGVTAVEHRFGPYGGQYVPETLMPALVELEDGVDRRARRSRLPRRARRAAARLRRPAVAAVPGRAAQRGAPATRSTSSARTSTTPARTRSTTRSARRCWPSGWASGASSPRPAPASTASRPRPRARCSTSSASSTWAPRTCAARSRTSSGWGCSARASSPSRPARGR